MNECPSPPWSKISPWGMFYIDFYKEKAKKKTQSLKNSSRALEWQRKGNNRGKLLLGLFALLEYILGL